MGCTDTYLVGGGRHTPSVSSRFGCKLYLIYADVRLHIPMTHRNARCHHHCGAWNTIMIDNDLVSGAIQKWYNSIGVRNAKKLWNQDQKYPCTACCQPHNVPPQVVEV